MSLNLVSQAITSKLLLRYANKIHQFIFPFLLVFVSLLLLHYSMSSVIQIFFRQKGKKKKNHYIKVIRFNVLLHID